MITSPAFRGKRYAVLGLARSGLASVEALVASGAVGHRLGQSRGSARRGRRQGRDRRPARRSTSPASTASSSRRACRSTATRSRPRRARRGVPLIGDIELFAQARAALAAAQGGRHHRHQRQVDHHRARPPYPQDRRRARRRWAAISACRSSRQEPLPEGGVYVLELSSYQIDLTFSLDCDVAVLLNVTPDHLDRYDGFEAYAASKARLFAMQSPDHAAVIATEDEYTRAIAEQVADRRFLVSSADVKDQSRWPALQGPHNAQNVARRGRGVRARSGSPTTIIARRARTYPGLPHRMERVAREARRPVRQRQQGDQHRIPPRRRSLSYPAVHWIVGGLAKTEDLGPVRGPARPCPRRLHDRRGRADVRAAARGQGAGARIRIAGRRRSRTRRPPRRRRARSSCSRRPAPRSTSSAIMRRAATPSGRGGGSGMSSRRTRPQDPRAAARPLGPERARPLVLGDRQGPAGPRRGADRRSA